MSHIAKVLLFISLTFVPFVAFSQSKSKKKLEEKKEERAKSSAKIIKDAEDFHMSIQSKETKKRLKANKKKSAMINSNMREPFYKRWFRKKH